MSKNVANHSDTRREDWGTPRELFGTLSKEHDFVIDLCANKHNALCDRYIDEHVDIFSSAAFGVVEEAKERAEVKTVQRKERRKVERTGTKRRAKGREKKTRVKKKKETPAA